MTPPLFRWVGSKRHLAAHIVAGMPKKYGHYWEPFAGAAAVFFALQPKRATLSDVNAELITTYGAIRSNVSAVIKALDALWHTGRSEKDYYRVRENVPKSSIGRAARFLYLQALSFNGLWRENRAGLFNVPYGKRPDVRPYSHERLRLAARELGPCDLAIADAFEILKKPKRGDLVYVDSPFLGTFTTYVDAVPWTPQKAEQLAALLFMLAHKGVHVVSSEADTPIIRKLYKGATITPIDSRQSIAANGDARGTRRDVLITFKTRG